MSTIDRRHIIKDLLERHGMDKAEGTPMTLPARWVDGKQREALKGRLLMGPRFTAETIWEYTTGFGGIAWKLIYGMYPQNISTEQAEATFLATGNIKPGTHCRCLLWNGNLTEAGKAFLDSHDEE